jgi:hypothetical protein
LILVHGELRSNTLACGFVKNDIQDGVRDEASGQAVGLKDVLDEEVFRRARDPRPPIRQAAYELITVLSRNAAFSLEAIPAGRLGNHVAQFTREKHHPCLEKMMLALLALVRACPQLWESGMPSQQVRLLLVSR